MDVSLNKLWEMVMARDNWGAAVHGVTKSQTWMIDWTISIYENQNFYVSYMKIWVYISIQENQIFVFSMWNMGVYLRMWKFYFLYFLYENRSSDFSLALDSFFFSPADSVPYRGCCQCTFPLTVCVCSLSSRLFPAFIVCELVRMSILNGGIWFLVVILFGIPAAIRNAEHHVPWGCVVFYLISF